jgi:hypothetical protein
MTRKIDFRFAPVPHELLFQAEVPSQVVHLWAAIYRIGDLRGGFGDGVLAIPLTELAEKLGWAEKTVARWAKVGADLGWINVRRRGQGLPNEYQVVSPDRTEVSALDRPSPAGVQTELSDPSSITERTDLERTTPAASGDVEQPDPDAWLKKWWVQQDPRPTQSFVAIRNVGRAALRNGWDVETLQRAMTEVPSISTGALDYWRSRQNGTARPSLRNAPGSPLAEGATDRTGESGAW